MNYTLRPSDIPNSFYRVYRGGARRTSHFNLTGLTFESPCTSAQLPMVGRRTIRPDLHMHAWYVTDWQVTAFVVEGGRRWSFFEGDVFGELALVKLGLMEPA